MSSFKKSGRNGNNSKPAPRCRKNLFGADHSQTQNDIESELKQLQEDECEKFKQKWNLNLNPDGSIKPVDGKYEWGPPLHLKPSKTRQSLLYIPPKKLSVASGSSIQSNEGQSSSRFIEKTFLEKRTLEKTSKKRSSCSDKPGKLIIYLFNNIHLLIYELGEQK